jgi:hypothetical protein
MPKIIGDRSTDPATKSTGTSFIRAKSGQTIGNFQAENIGNGVVVIEEAVDGLVVQDIHAVNCYRFLEMVQDKGALTNAVIRDCKLEGTERGFARLRGKVSNVLFENIWARGGQIGDPFPMGFHVESGEDITFRNCVSADMVTPSVPGAYRQGDGFATEGAARRINFANCTAQGCNDGGFDVKHLGGYAKGNVAQDCKIGWREWNNRPDGELLDLTVLNCAHAMGFYKPWSVVHIQKLIIRADRPMSSLFLSNGGHQTLVVHEHDIQVPAGTKMFSGDAMKVEWKTGAPKL